MSINIPTRLHDKLNEDVLYLTKVNQLIMNTKSYFSMLNLKFFPEYTSHRVDHVNRVLQIMDKLIPDETLKKISPRSMCIVINSAIVHDLGMFIQEDGVCRILWGDRKNEKTEYLDEKTWEELWNDYIVSASRYSDTQLVNVFGSKEEFKEPKNEPEHWNNRDILVIGEFLRRHHHRLAFEFCKNGFYGKRIKNILEGVFDSNSSDADLIAIISRSHGMQIRDTEKYFDSKYTTMSKPLGIPVVYLMSLLRLADYLDAGECRAPQEILEAQHINSKISVKEWTWNQTINFSDYSWDEKPDTLSIFSSPTDNITYLVVKDWLNSLQMELDLCWAIISENCYAYNLSIHRIVSNITNPKTIDEFKKKFSVNEAKLNANPELLKLLIQPLYGNSPTFGVRELIQNATDACIERQFLEKDNGDYKPLITVSVDTKKKKFTIIDNGIGMTENVIINYFLSAGSSFRSSDEWKNNYEKNENSQISRSGKFGVGILSAFLIGERITVTTKSIKDEKGYTFSMPFDSTNINLMRTDVSNTGTVIDIDIDDERLDWFMDNDDWYHWYHFSKPKIAYIINDKIIKFNNEWRVPNVNDRLKKWYKIKTKEFEMYRWSYNSVSPYTTYKTRFFCNGITIPTSCDSLDTAKYGFEMRYPNVSIVDKNGKLSIDLARSKVLNIPLETKLIEEMYKYLIAKLLFVNWENSNITVSNLQNGFFIDEYHPLFNDYRFIVSNKGYMIYQDTFCKALNIKEIVVVCLDSDFDLDLDGFFMNNEKPVCFVINNKYRLITEFNNDNILDGYIMNKYDNNYLPNKPQDIWITNEIYNYVKEIISEKLYGYYDFEDLIEYIHYHSDFNISSLNEKVFMSQNAVQAVIHYTEFNDHNYYSPYKESYANIMASVIKEYLGDDIWIPFDMDERKKKFPKAFKSLKKYVD